MKEVEARLKDTNIPELSDFHHFYIISLYILNNQYTKAKDELESSSISLEEILFLKTFVYEKLQILTLQKICFDMLSPEYQNKYKLIMANNISTVNEEYARIEEMYELQNLDLLTLKKISWKEMLLKANESFKSLLYEYVEGNKSLYKDCEYFTELVHLPAGREGAEVLARGPGVNGEVGAGGAL